MRSVARRPKRSEASLDREHEHNFRKVRVYQYRWELRRVEGEAKPLEELVERSYVVPAWIARSMVKAGSRDRIEEV